MTSNIDQEFNDGYMDGRNKDNPSPSGNRHPAYIHSFKVARAELSGKPIPADQSRKEAEKIVEAENDQ